MAEGYPPLRFLNPWLHSGGYKGLNDIIGGNNPGCSIPGFDAVKGWDPVTGLGTPNLGCSKISFWVVRRREMVKDRGNLDSHRS